MPQSVCFAFANRQEIHRIQIDGAHLVMAKYDRLRAIRFVLQLPYLFQLAFVFTGTRDRVFVRSGALSHMDDGTPSFKPNLIH